MKNINFQADWINVTDLQVIILSNEKDDGSLCLSWLDVLKFDKPKRNFFQNSPITNFFVILEFKTL